MPPEEAFWSPYTGLDALCGNTLLISLDALVAAGLLARADLPPARPVADVDFPSARPLIELRCVLRSAGLSACLSACLSRPARVDHGPCSWLPATPGLTAGATAPCRIKGLRVSCRSAQVLEERTPLLRKAADAARAAPTPGSRTARCSTASRTLTARCAASPGGSGRSRSGGGQPRLCRLAPPRLHGRAPATG